jgi:uncharacterized surface protein with fasciclin (FAS1) repeats
MKLKSKVFGVFFALAMVCSAMAGSASAQDNMMGKTIVDVAMSDSRFSTLVELVKEAGLVDTLKGAGPYTVFAPTNDAFAKIPADKLAALKGNPEMLKKVLLYHVMPAKVAAADAKTMMAPTAEGSSASVKVKTEGGTPTVMIDKAKVIQADIMASNGVIHAIDTVLMPKMDKKMSKME